MQMPAPDPACDAALATGLAFAPLPSRTGRHDGWTADRQVAFIDALARIGVVSAAARSVGMSPKSAYALRNRAGAAGFVRAWDFALHEGWSRARDMAVDRALNGTLTPVFYRGLRIGTKVTHHNRLLVAALRTAPPAPARAGGRFAAGKTEPSLPLPGYGWDADD